MDWSSERYVRLYTRETVEMAFWSWQALAVWPWLLARCDRNGRLGLGKHGREGLAVLLKMPAEVVSEGLDCLLSDGCVTERHDSHGFVTLDVPNFVAAQDTRSRAMTAAERQAAKRARDLEEKANHAESLGARHECHGVTQASRMSPQPAVPAVPSVPATPEEEPSPSAPAKRARKVRTLSPAAVRVRDAIEAGTAVTYPPGSFDALEARLREGLTEDDAHAVVRHAAADLFWGGKVRCDPATLFRPSHLPGLLAKAKAGPAPQHSTPAQRGAAYQLARDVE